MLNLWLITLKLKEPQKIKHLSLTIHVLHCVLGWICLCLSCCSMVWHNRNDVMWRQITTMGMSLKTEPKLYTLPTIWSRSVPRDTTIYYMPQRPSQCIGQDVTIKVPWFLSFQVGHFNHIIRILEIKTLKCFKGTMPRTKF